MKKKVITLIIGTALSLIALTGCGGNPLTQNLSELAGEFSSGSSDSEAEQAPAMLHLHDETSEKFCVDFPSNWEITEHEDIDEITHIYTAPVSDHTVGTVDISFCRSDSPDPDIDGYNKIRDANMQKHYPDCVFDDGTTASNSYRYHVTSYINEDDHQITDYQIFDGNSKLSIVVEINDPENEDLTSEISDTALMMVNSAILYHPAEATEAAE